MLTSVYAVHEDSVEKADLPVFIESLLEEWNAARKPGQFVFIGKVIVVKS